MTALRSVGKFPSSMTGKQIALHAYRTLDRWGIALSFLCLIHCVATPLILLSLPIMARYYLAHPWFHLVLALVIIPVGGLAFVRGYRHHKRSGIVALGLTGLVIITVAPFLVHALKYNLNEPLLMILGSVALITAHLRNQKACRCHTH